MKDTLNYLLTAITTHPEAIEITEEAENDGRTTYVVKVHPEDMGRVIGREGRIIRAIRDLVKLIATKENRFVDVELADDRETSSRVANPS